MKSPWQHTYFRRMKCYFYLNAKLSPLLQINSLVTFHSTFTFKASLRKQNGLYFPVSPLLSHSTPSNHTFQPSPYYVFLWSLRIHRRIIKHWALESVIVTGSWTYALSLTVASWSTFPYLNVLICRMGILMVLTHRVDLRLRGDNAK